MTILTLVTHLLLFWISEEKSAIGQLLGSCCSGIAIPHLLVDKTWSYNPIPCLKIEMNLVLYGN